MDTKTPTASPGYWISDKGLTLSRNSVRMLRDSCFGLGNDGDGRRLEIKLRAIDEVSEILERLG
jgi:hypothetical protein